LLAGCIRTNDREVIVYTALDREFSEPIFRDFEAKTGIHVRAKYDPESTKTVQLVTDIIAEKQRPRCDLFWNNEILNTIRLEQLGMLSAYVPEVADDYPASTRSPTGNWHGFAARARVLLVNTEIVPADETPTSVFDLVDSKWNGKVGIAKPLFGSTATHAVCLFEKLGSERAMEFFRDVAESARVMSGNRQVAIAVARGQIAFGLTDTDDALVQLEQGFPVRIVYPDQEDGQMGTLFFPNTLSLIKGSPHRELAQELVDYLLSPEVESQLATGPSGQIPLNRTVQVDRRVESPESIRALDVDFQMAASQWDFVGRFLESEFAAPP
jgi:iron(III) transport system substrate-binding protein